jgi:hypothetical protein
MKKFVLLLCAVLALSVTGCGSSKAETPAPTAIPAATEAPPAETKAPEATPVPEVTPEPAAESSEAEKQIALVKELIGRPVAELYAAIGEPSGGSDYGPSCLVTGGKDGMLYYDGFTVYTLVQPDGSESVYDVE